ncbi:MAG: MBL fold metallo-hydrolase [Candidatus Heimdallarchaeota archaeon]|nr:MBL fold metallo-hydrolase [Candidatus Heimdallarchaeota archaeon]MDH5645553.1 MBL fold metallo-hydrolase [Candidatus Heimdallarchaeota archaeon]
MNKLNNLRLTAFGAAGEVGRSAFIIEDGEHAILLEAGIKLRPSNLLSLAPKGLKKRAKDLDAVILSHAHVDHSGYLPALWEAGYYGKLYMTNPTMDILEILWLDHHKIEGERHWTLNGMERAFQNTVTLPYKKKVKIADGITLEFFNSGHIIGSAMSLIDWKGIKILYTGDINDAQTPLFDGFHLPDVKVDILITEATNGDRKVIPRSEVNSEFIKELRNTLNSGKKVVIPSFAIGRSQELLCILSEHIKDFPIYVDGMINKMNVITEKYLTSDWVDETILNRLKRDKISSPLRGKNITSLTKENFDRVWEERKLIGQIDEPLIIVTTSGMMEPSPVHEHLRNTAADQGNLIAVTGYQAEGTKGREIIEGAKKVMLSLGPGNAGEEEVEINAKLMRFGFSGHTSSDGVKDLIEHTKPERVFLVHADVNNATKMKELTTNGKIPELLEINKVVKLI